MTLQAQAGKIRSLSEAIVERAFTNALTELRRQRYADTGKYRKKMSGNILANGVTPLGNFRTFNGSEGNEKGNRTEKDSKLLEASIPNTNSLLQSKEEGKQGNKMTSLGTIQEDGNETDSSNDEGSVTLSESDSDSDTSDGDSSDNSEEPTIEYTFPSHHNNQQGQLPSSDKEKTGALNSETSFHAAETEPNMSTSGASGHIKTNGFINNQTVATNESLLKDSVLSDGSIGNETSTSRSSDVVLGMVSKKGDDPCNTVEINSSEKENGTNSLNEIPRPNPESTVVNSTLKHVEEKLVELEESNKEQTSEIKRLKSENDILKTSFHKLEKSSEHYHDDEGRMLLKRNEELEKHLLGVLKSQEIIFDLKEKLNATTSNNMKLSKDYQEAIKALEAVDKMFGQKDALVEKWKEASEESRRLVELLKKHNAEIADLEQVDQLKEEIANLKEECSKAEQINEEGNKKNEALQNQSKVWKKKFEYENEQGIKLGCELQAMKRALNKHEKLAAKRGRKNQLLQLEATELKDTLKLAKDKLVENERRMKELEIKSTSAQETYTSIIHEKEKQHSVLIKNSEAYQQDLVAKVAEGLKKEIDSLKQTISVFESQKIEAEEKLRKSEKNLEETLAKQVEMKTCLETLQPELERSKITSVDNELYIEEQTVRLQELEEQCRELQGVLQQFIYKDTKRHKRHSSYHGKHLRPTHTFPTHPNLDMYRKLLAPPKSMPPHRKRPVPREAWSHPGQSDEDKIEVNMNKAHYKVGEPFVTTTVHPVMSQQTRPRSTYGNRSLSAANHSGREQTEQNRDWIPKIVLVDSQKLETGSENDSGGTSISADQYAMEHVKLGDRVLIEMPVEGRKQNLPGVVKYIGPVYHENFKKGIYAGLKLDIPVGDTNGKIGGRHYFHCLMKHGKFIKMSHILAVQNARNQQFTRILQMGYK